MRVRRPLVAATAAAGIVSLAAVAAQPVATAAPPDREVRTNATANAAPPARTGAVPDDLPHPLGDKQRALRKAAIEKVLRGEAKVLRRGDSGVVQVAKDQYAEVTVQDTDQIFTILTEFGDQIDPRTGGAAGPLHNQIAEPVARQNNTTYWVSDFDRQHYLDLFFGTAGESMADFYSEQSQGRYTVDGDVSDWVKLPYNEARYGSNAIASSDGYWNYIKDTAQAWYDAQVAAGKTPEEIREYLARFDVWDRYDYDTDGDFNEPDGYIDHFQAVHAGEGEEAGGGAEGGDAIWSHRWYAFPGSDSGPEFNRRGGVPLGDSGIWIGDYTTEPENGGLGVFAHEFGHDLGLPDLYDTAGGENGTAFWTLMSSGSWLGHGEGTIGTTPGYMGAWEKLMLGWLDYQVASPDDDSTTVLGPAALTTDAPQALVVPLPKDEVTTEYNTPHSGSYEWWAGSADDLNAGLVRTIDLTDATSAEISAKAWYEIEEGYDFLHAEVSADGRTWESVGDPVDGSSGGEWTDLTYDLSAYAGQQIRFRFRYATDGGVHLAGPMLDDIVVTIDGEPAFTDDVEEDGRGWSTNNWTRITGTVTDMVGSYYLAEHRTYDGYDSTLRDGPYNFNRSFSKPDWVEHFPYQDGLLIWYWNERYEDNNTSEHPGAGLVLPVDARPKALRYDNGSLLSNRLQPFDATFGVERTDKISLSREVERGNRVQVTAAHVPSQAPVTGFDDSKRRAYWDASNPQSSVQVAGHGVRIDVEGRSEDGSELTVRVHPAD